ncbi:thiamine diphosphokinase [Bibersteinia trehalosi]|uniref:Thiamine diphosphokinase n=2 Tax=Bibersteinia trehalosi TaxID=47735 RepID=A0A3R8LDQ7_BIBTR|nr:thiamine diphosphokinase [Bibersteinia trehalosi]AGH38941.1 Thiamine pyrophosphokinase [Bibersteinia trehalosi USDA-ARS-USMARC-192]AHG83525.1 Thiamine pyrophosphokinase [Bibersteinia trehalosi USDA-ARS-USMARC-189]RRN04419.1 thiamine diphosphokinase [Bibersteinia trehalosi]TCT17342.1 thiamine pyrophosphokinase [Bibersteinia trehalosi]
MLPTKAAILLNTPHFSQSIAEEYIICADGGANLLAEGRAPYAIVGDLDSVHQDKLQGKVLSCPREKDYTDGEKAVRFAAEQGFQEIVIYGASGGRADHIYANLSLLALAQTLGLKAMIDNPQEQIAFFLQGKVQLNLPIGATFSCLPYGDSATVSHSQGLYYPYQDLILDRRYSVGISNIVTQNLVSFEVLQGAVFVFIGKEMKGC